MRTYRILAITFALPICLGGSADAQLAPPSARSFGLAGSFTARARGYESAFWNPANLGLPNGPAWSVGLPGASVFLGNNSLGYGQIADLYGEFIDDATKSELLADIRRDDPDRMFELSFDLGGHVLGFSLGRLAVTLGVIGAGSLEVSPDAMELLLFGNVGEDGSGRDFTLDGSQGQAWSLSGASISYAQPFTVPALDWLGMKLSLGATVKYGVAHGLARLADRGSLLAADPLSLDVEAEVLASTDMDAGRIWAVDVGAAMDWKALVVGVSFTNALADIVWREDDFELTQYSLLADFDSTTLTDTTFAFAELSPVDQERLQLFLNRADVPKQLRLAGLYRVSPILSVSADISERIGGSLRSGWERSIAVGAELRPVSSLPLRAGVATDFTGVAYTGGLGVYSGPVHVDISVGRWGVLGGDGIAAALSIGIWPGTRF